MASVPNHPPIHTFAPNSGAKAAAESLVGLAGLGIIAEWSFDEDTGTNDTDSPWTVREHGGAELIPMTSREVKWYARGALAAMSRYGVIDRAQ